MAPHKLVVIICSIVCTISIGNAQWVQKGDASNGEQINDRFGYSMSISADGNTMVIGGLRDTNDGFVKVYTLENENWVQKGNTLNGPNDGENFGASVSISADGNIIAVGSPFWLNATGSVTVFEYNTDTNKWIGISPFGSLRGASTFELFGASVSLNDNATILAVGANGSLPGFITIIPYVAIFKRDEDNNWIQIGEDIVNPVRERRNVSLNADGTIVAIGIPGSPPANNPIVGSAKIFQNVNDVWTQVGETIEGNTGDDRFGKSISISNDGTIVAVGAPNNDANGENSGQVRIFKNDNGIWTQMGSNINGTSQGDEFGTSVSLSGDGTILAIGANKNNNTGSDAGLVKVYEFSNNNWNQMDQDINGQSAGDQFGFSVSLSDDGNTLCIGATLNDTIEIDSGQVRVYSWEPSLSVSENLPTYANTELYPNPTKDHFYITKSITENSTILITDFSGKHVYRSTLPVINTDTKIELPKLIPGVYVINISSKQGSVSHKLVIR